MQIAFAPADVVTGVALAWPSPPPSSTAKRPAGPAINSSLLLSALTLQAGSREIGAIDEEVRQTRRAHLAEARARGATIEEIYAERRKLMPELPQHYYRPYKTKDSYLVVGCLGPVPASASRQAPSSPTRAYDPVPTPPPSASGAELVALCEAKFQSAPTTSGSPTSIPATLPVAPFALSMNSGTTPRSRRTTS